MQYLVISQHLDIILRITQLILLLTLFSIFHLLSHKRGRKKLLLPIRSEIKVLYCPPRTRSIFRFICAQCIISRVFYALCVSRTINPARITNVHFIDFRSFPQRNQDKERETKRRMKDVRVRSVSFLARLLNFI